MRRLSALVLVVVLALGACDAVFRFNDVRLPVDASPPELDASCSFSRLFDTCQLGDPGSWQNDVEVTSDSTSDVFMKVDNVDVASGTLHVVKVKQLAQLGGTTLVLVGNKSFVIVSDGDIRLQGTVIAGAGDRAAADCGLATGSRGAADSGGAGGGGGGALGGNGGNGGRGDMDGMPMTGALGGAPGTAIAWNGRDLIGGCPGGDGGSGATMPGGAGGNGGGALALISRNAVHIDTSGIVTAAGRAGGGGLGSAAYATGGGGGGAGGMIWIEAPVVTIDGVVAANGAGGGEGGATGGNGASGTPGTNADVAAKPGAGNLSGGGDGGSGAHASHPTGYDSTQWLNGGGGGGGGGVGIIVIVTPSPAPFAGLITPNPTPAP